MGTLLRLPERLTDGVVVLDGHTLADAPAHWAGEDEEMWRRFDAPRRATLGEVRGAMQRWMDARAAGEPNFCYAVRGAVGAQMGGVLMGGCEVRWLADAPGALNLSYWSYPPFRGRGFVGRAVALVLGAVPATGARQIEARVDADNVASRRVAERAGFVEDGTANEESWSTGEMLTRVRYVRTVA
jgi:RimJ/RimL family protein N-acetyltransferase